MAGSSMTFTEQRVGTVKCIKAVWVSDSAAGTASGTTTYAYDGMVILVVTDPDAGGTQPSDNYTLTVADQNGIDVLAGACSANRDNTNTEYVTSALAGVAHSKLTVAISGAGNSKGGTAYIYIR